MSQIKTASPEELKKLLADGKELALVDVREQGVYFDEHLLFACCIPLSRLELMVADLIPRRSTRIVLCDGGVADNALARRAAEKLLQFSYADIRLLDGGVGAWRSAGFELFSGINVPSKAFGEFVEINYDTPRIEAEELHGRLQSGEKIVILDSRPMDEFERMSIPGGIDCPGAELVYRVHDQVSDDATPVVVNCAGRTRSIIGAQSLINAGIPNPVMALKDGTMGWKLAGFDLAHGETEHAAEPSVQGLASAQAGAQRVAERFGVQRIDFATLRTWQNEVAQRTLYLLDVRSPQEYEAGHIAQSRNAPGGQLVQATDEYMATRNARVVLVDDNEVRATMTASWLIQMGWNDVFVLQSGSLFEETLTTGPRSSHVLGVEQTATLSPQALHELLGADTAATADGAVIVLDLATSLQYRRGHIPGAYWGLRVRLAESIAQLPAHGRLILSAHDEALGHLAAKDIAALGHKAELSVLAGGNNAWRNAGYELVTGDERFISETNDVWYKPYEHRGAVEQAMRDYLTWEVNLVGQIERDGDAQFRLFNN